MVTYLALYDCAVVATGPLPAMGRGTKHPPMSYSPARAYALWYLLFLGIWAHEQELVSGL